MNDDQYKTLEEKIDSIKSEVADLRVVVAEGFAKYNSQLEVHIIATHDNRDAIKAVKTELIPVQDHVKFMQSLAKLVLGLGTIASAIFAGLKLFLAK